MVCFFERKKIINERPYSVQNKSVLKHHSNYIILFDNSRTSAHEAMRSPTIYSKHLAISVIRYLTQCKGQIMRLHTGYIVKLQ